jgi:hypothetical protein
MKELKEFSESEDQFDEDEEMEYEDHYEVDVNDWVVPSGDSYDPRNTSNYVSSLKNPSFGQKTSD